MGKTIAERGTPTPPHILQPEEEEMSDKGEKVRTNSGVCGTKMSCLAYILQVGVSLIEL